MTQISRPFQIALVAVVLIAAVWFVALRGHSSSSSGESSAPAPAASSAASSSGASSGSAASGAAASQSASGSTGSASSGSASSGSSTYHGSAPGVDGLTRAIQKAHGAVAASEQNAKALQQKAETASASRENLGSSATGTKAAQGSTASASGAAATGGTAAKRQAAKTHSSGSGSGSAAKTTSKAAAPKATETKTASGIPLMQARVEAELKQGKVAALLFWNPQGSVDTTVRRELQAAGKKLHGKLAISVARSNQVGSFGSFTRTVQVYGTPTILLINPAGHTLSLTGLTDSFSIAQAVKEVKQAK